MFVLLDPTVFQVQLLQLHAVQVIILLPLVIQVLIIVFPVHLAIIVLFKKQSIQLFVLLDIIVRLDLPIMN